jgi:hypothetical protein
MAKAAALMGSSPSMTMPSSSTRMRSETLIWEKCAERGFSQKWSVRIGCVIWLRVSDGMVG